MFDYKQDVGLLHGSLLSAASSNSGSLFGCDDVENAVNILYNTVKKIIHSNINGIKEEKENIKMQLQINEKLHAAIFFTVLRSHGIMSQAANTFYNSIVHSWPTMDLKCYVELNFKCDWNEYFIKCAVQLPSEVLYKVLNLFLSISFSSHIEYYVWHLILQTIILKLLEVPDDNEKKYPFDFDFETEPVSSVKDEAHNKIPEESNGQRDGTALHLKPDVIPLFRELYNNLCNCISLRMTESNEIDVVKVLLHAAKMILKSLLTEKQIEYSNVSRFDDLIEIFHLLENYFALNDKREMLIAALQNSACTVVNQAYATTSWNISLNYLAFLLAHYLSEISSDSKLSEKNALVYTAVVDTTFYKVLSSWDISSINVSVLDNYLKMLCKIIQFGFQGQSFAAQIFLEPTIIEKNDIIKVLEENSQLINLELQYKQVIYCIKSVKSQESKLKLLKVLYKMLQEHDIEMYDTVLNFILHNYGSTDEFKLPDFRNQFLQLARKTPTLKEAEEILPALLVQNPVTIMKYIIDQALVQGSEGKHFIQFLKHFQKTCMFQSEKSDVFLHSILNEYFVKSKLEVYESKNMIILYTFLLEVHFEKPILLPALFLRECISPKLLPSNDKIHLLLECFHVLLPALLSDDCIHEDSSTMMCLIVSLGNLVDHCIQTGNGKLKSLVTPMLKKLEVHEKEHQQMRENEKEELFALFCELDEIVSIYVQEFLPSYIEFSSKSSVWTWCCKNEIALDFEEKFSLETLTYPLLLNTLVKVLPHLTKEECLYSFQLLKLCCRNSTLRDEVLCSFNNLFYLSEGEAVICAVISCFITSLHFILNDSMGNLLYIIDCFTNGLLNLLNEEETVHTHVLITIFLDICNFVACISPDLINAFKSILLHLKKLILDSCSGATNEEYCKKLMSDAIICLPYSSQKMILFRILQ